MELTPIFKLEAKGKDITDHVAKNLESLTFTDEEGSASDELRFSVYGDFQRPAYQDELKLYLGYKETSLFYCGLFTVQSTVRNQYQLLEVRATGADFTDTLKERRHKAYEQMSVADICSEVAGRHNLSLKSDYSDIYLPYIAQTNESDLHFLKRIAKELDALFSIKNNHLHFLKRRKSGKLSDSRPAFDIDAALAQEFRFEHSNRTIYRSAKATWHDNAKNLPQEVVVGNGSPVLNIRGTFKDAAEARIKAQAKLDAANRGAISGSITVPGIEIYGGGRINITNAGDDSGTYSIMRVRHTFDKGWKAAIEFEN